jgi:hypothetical protein
MNTPQDHPNHRRPPAIVQEQGKLVAEDFYQALQDPMTGALWRWLCHLLATQLKRPYTGWIDVRLECARLNPSAKVEEMLPKTDWETAEAIAQLMRQRETAIAKSFGPFLHSLILTAALWELGIKQPWPKALAFGMVQLLPDNPLWIDAHDGSIHGTETALPEHL